MRAVAVAVRAAVVGALALASGCYASYSSCGAYYGYYDYYCDYYWYDYWWYYEYDWYYYRTLPPESYPHPNPEIDAQPPGPSTRVDEVVLLQPGPAAQRPTNLGERFGMAYPCGRGDHGYTVCDEGSAAMDPDQEHLLLAMRLGDDFDFEPGDDRVVVRWAFDSDNDPSNNLLPAWFDSYAGATDLVYAAVWEPAVGWRLEVTDWRGAAPQSIGTNGRVVFDGDTAVLVVPLDDFIAQDPGVRLSIFREANDGTWSGFVHPLPGGDLIRPIPR